MLQMPTQQLGCVRLSWEGVLDGHGGGATPPVLLGLRPGSGKGLRRQCLNPQPV